MALINYLLSAVDYGIDKLLAVSSMVLINYLLPAVDYDIDKLLAVSSR